MTGSPHSASHEKRPERAVFHGRGESVVQLIADHLTALAVDTKFVQTAILFHTFAFPVAVIVRLDLVQFGITGCTGLAQGLLDADPVAAGRSARALPASSKVPASRVIRVRVCMGWFLSPLKMPGEV